MRFSCESCQTRYTLADEKVRGRVLRVRCKTCGASILVREGGAQTVVADSPGPGRSVTPAPGLARVATPSGGLARAVTPAAGLARAATPAPRAASPGVEWFAMIQGKQQGPFDEKALAARIEDGSIGVRSFLWNEAQSDWKRGSDIPALAVLLSRAVASSNPGRTPAIAVPALESLTPTPARAPVPRPALQEMPSLADLVAELPQPSDQHPLLPLSPPAPQGTGDFTRMVMMRAGVDARGRKKRTLRLLMVGGGVLALAALTIVLLPEAVLPAAPRAQGGKAPGEKAPWTAEGMESLRDRLLGRGEQGRAVASGPGASRPGRRDDGAVIHRAERSAQPVSAATQNELAQLYGDSSKHDAKVDTRVQADAPRADKVALDASAISKTVSDNAGSYKRCIDDYLRRNPGFRGGKVEITATIAPSGIVTAAAISDRAVDGTDLGACLRDRTKRIIFPRFEGDPFDVTYPLVLGSSGG